MARDGASRREPFNVLATFLDNFFLIVGTCWGLFILWLFLPQRVADPVMGVVIGAAVGVYMLVFLGGTAACVALPFAMLGRGLLRLARGVAHVQAHRPEVAARPDPGAVTHLADCPAPAVPAYLARQAALIRTVATVEERKEIERLCRSPQMTYSEQMFWQSLVHRWSAANPHQDGPDRAPGLI